MDEETKLLWIEALQATIDQYTREINDNIEHNPNICPLCIMDEKIGCDTCIHMNKEFGQGKECYNQRSYNTDLIEYDIQLNPFMKYRRSYLRKMRNKLIESL